MQTILANTSALCRPHGELLIFLLIGTKEIRIPFVEFLLPIIHFVHWKTVCKSKNNHMPGKDGGCIWSEELLRKIRIYSSNRNISNFNETVSQVQFPVIHFKTSQIRVTYTYSVFRFFYSLGNTCAKFTSKCQLSFLLEVLKSPLHFTIVQKHSVIFHYWFLEKVHRKEEEMNRITSGKF